MLFLIFSVLASVSVSLLLKFARARSLSIEQMVACNYWVAIALTLLFLQPDIALTAQSVQFSSAALWLLLGILLPSVFVAMGRAVASAGIIKSDAAQRLSLFLPVLAAFTLFGEAIVPHRLAGLVLAMLALCGVLYKPEKSQPRSSWWLLAVWLGYGVIDILFKQLSKQGTAFAGSLLMVFSLAAVLMSAYLWRRKTQWHRWNVLAGMLLGVLNFLNILFYIKAHQAFKESPTLVFAGMNMGVIVLGTLAGALIFRERVNALNWAGIVLALSAIACLYYGQSFF